MTPYGKSAQTAIAAVSRLAQVYDPAKPVRLNSAEIAASRNLPQPAVAKVLTTLSQAGMIVGSPGPGGGYALARPPGEITLYEVACLFDRMEEGLGCPFGPNWCGTGPQCPLHERLDGLRSAIEAFLRGTTFAGFVGHPQPAVSRPPAPGSLPVLPTRPGP